MKCEKSEKEVEAPPDNDNTDNYVVSLPRPLTLDEKKYLLAVERGDLANVRRILQAANHHLRENKTTDVNCVDSLGRGALTLAIESENLEMVELLVVMGVETKDALLHAIDQEFVEAVELLLEHEELLRSNELPQQCVKDEDREVTHSWQRVQPAAARYPPDMTPLVLAAQRDNYEILKLLLDRGATLPMPHDVRCGCPDCIRSATGDPLRLSSTRISEYKALASPCLIALSSTDPLMTAFQLSWELREMAITEPENRHDYTKLRRQVEKFAMDLLQQARSTSELSTILNHDPEEVGVEAPKQLARLELAIQYKQKRLVAHAHVQQLLAAIWYEGVPGFRRMRTGQRVWIVVRTALLFPFYCLVYLLSPESKTGQLVRKPFMKFLIHASSYLFFLLILILVSQRAEVEAVRLLGTEKARRSLEEDLLKQRGAGPSPLECLVLIYVIGFIWQETREMYEEGLRGYLRDLWNFIDFTRNSLYVATAFLRVAAYAQQRGEIREDPSAALIPRERWGDYDPQLIAEGLFAAANVFSALKVVHLFSIDPHLGPLQISLGRMVIDIVKFFFIYTLVLFAFACGLNQLLWYFAELEKQKCYGNYADPNWDAADDACLRWRKFSSLFESCQSLFWASFGGLGIDNFELAGIKSYTRFWGLLMFGSYSVINVIVLLNLLIAMMSNSYAVIEEHSDTEWKFARTKLWLRYFEEGNTLPPPFNIFPAPKIWLRLCGLRKSDLSRRNSARQRARDHKYGAVMRALVWRYVVSAHYQQDMQPVTEDDVHELKTDLSSWRCELLNILQRNGMDICGVDTKDKMVLGRKMRVWERRLMKDFQVAGPVTGIAEEEALEEMELRQPPEGEDTAARWRRVARLAVLRSAERRWGQVITGVVQSSQIGKSNSRASLQNQQSLRRAMEHAKRLAAESPLPPASPIQLPPSTAANILHILKNIDENDDTCSRPVTPVRLEPSPYVKTNAPAAMGYIDEKYRRSPQPLVSLRNSPPRVIKRKAPTKAFNASSSNSNSTSSSNSNNSANINTGSRSPTKTFTGSASADSKPSAISCNQGNSLKPGQNTNLSANPIIGKSDSLERANEAKPSATTTSTPSANVAVPATLTVENSVARPRPRPPVSPKKLPRVAIIPVTPGLGNGIEEDRQRLVKIEPKSPRFSTSKSPRRGGGWL